VAAICAHSAVAACVLSGLTQNFIHTVTSAGETTRLLATTLVTAHQEAKPDHGPVLGNPTDFMVLAWDGHAQR